MDDKNKMASMDDSIFVKSKEELREEYKKKYGEYPKPLTDEEKREYGLIK